MSLRYNERMNNTPEQVAEYLQTAANIVADLDIAPDLIPHAFVQAVGLVASKQIEVEQIGLGMPMIGPNQH